MKTFDPFKTIDRPTVNLYRGVSSPSMGGTLVVYQEGRGLRVLGSTKDRLTAGELLFGGIRDYYLVDTTNQLLEFSAVLPCLDGVGNFDTLTQYTCRVIDPGAVVSSGIHDVGSEIVPSFTQALRLALQQYEAEDWRAAEEAGRQALAMAAVNDSSPFDVAVVRFELKLDSAAAAYIGDRQEAVRNLGRAEDAVTLSKQAAQAEAEVEQLKERLAQDRLELQRTRNDIEESLAMQRAELEAERERLTANKEFESTRELEIAKLKFEMERQQVQAELDAQRLQIALQQSSAQAELDRQTLAVQLELEELQVKRLAAMLEHGDFQGFALQLVRNPEDIEKINVYLANRQSRDAERQLEALKILVESDGLEGWQVSEQAKTVLQRLLASWSSVDRQITTGGPEQPAVDSAGADASSATQTESSSSESFSGDIGTDQSQPRTSVT